MKPNELSSSSVRVRDQVWPAVNCFTTVGPPPASPANGNVNRLSTSGVHLAELAPELMTTGAVPVDLEIHVLTVRGRTLLLAEVVRQIACAGALDVRQRIHVQDLQRDRVHPILGNDVVRKRQPAGDSRREIRGCGIVDHLQRAVGVEGVAKVAVAERRVRYGAEHVLARVAEVAFIRSEKEQLVADDWAAEGAACRLPLDRKLVGHGAAAEVVRIRVEFLVVEELERGTLEGVRARFRRDGNRSAGGHTVFRVHAACCEAHRVDGFDRLNVYARDRASPRSRCVAPSVRVVFEAPLKPLTFMFNVRCGVSVSAFCNVGGREPGASTTSAW